MPSSLLHPRSVVDAGAFFMGTLVRAAAARCALARFCQLSFAPTVDSRRIAACTDLWPCPPPDPLHFGSVPAQHRRAHRWQHVAVRLMVRFEAAALKWLARVCPGTTPSNACAGAARSSAQDRVIARHERLTRSLVRPGALRATVLGRALDSFAD